MNTNRMMMAALLAACVAGLAGCGKADNDTNPSASQSGMGPAQQAGKALDDVSAKAAVKVQEEVGKADAAARQARDAVPDAVDKARDNLGQVTDKVGKKVEEAGQKMQQAAH